MNCEFCNKTFSTKGTLKNHQNTAKYCLELQGNNLDNKYECKKCYKVFTQKIRLNTHKCNDKNIIIKELEYKNKDLEYKNKELEKKLEIEINSLKEQNKSLKEQNKLLKEQNKNCMNIIGDIAKEPKNNITNINKSTNSYNNKIMNMNTFNMNKDRIKHIFENNLTQNDIVYGQKSIANFAFKNLLKDDECNLVYICTDPSRNIFKYKDESGDIQRDINANKLTNLLVESGLKEINTNIALKSWTKNDGSQDMEKYSIIEPMASEINNLKNDNIKFVSELATITAI